MQAKSELEKLATERQSNGFSGRLARLSRPEGVSPSFPAIIAYLGGKIDAIDGLVKLTPIKLAQFSTLGTKPSLFEW